MSDYIANPLSRLQIRVLALSIRKTFKLENEICFPVLEMLEVMPDIFSQNNFTYEIVPDSELPKSIQGDTDVANHYIRIKESVYEGACIGNGRDRYSIVHEISHYILLAVLGFSFQRNISKRELKAFEDPEWQAECLAGELLMPYNLIKGLTVNEITEKCIVSLKAAQTQSKFI
jgi:Zn-dependent peptidase ImmA (M78 family)